VTGPTDLPPGNSAPRENPGASAFEDEAPRTRIIRRAPTTPLPEIADDFKTTHIPRQPPLQRSPYPAPGPAPRLGPPAFGHRDEPSDRTAVAACAVTFISGWATTVVATDLIGGWWHTDRLFCLAVAFLALVFAVTTVSGVILLMLHRGVGRRLIMAGAVVALLTYLGVFVAGARVAWIVYLLPLLPIASIVLALNTETKRWAPD
jgi:hypothetical protein